MATDEKKAAWEAKLVKEAWVIKGIKTENGDMMKAVYDTLGIPQDDYRTQSQVNAFIEERQVQEQPQQRDGEGSTPADGKKSFGFGSFFLVEFIHIVLG